MGNPIRTRDRYIFETFEEINNMKTKEERVAAIKHLVERDRDGEGPFATLLTVAFNKFLSFHIPDSVPEYRASQEQNAPTDLKREFRKIPLFLDRGNGAEVNRIKLENVFIGILEGIHPQDAELLANIFARNWPYSKISQNVMMEAAPQLLRKPSWYK